MPPKMTDAQIEAYVAKKRGEMDGFRKSAFDSFMENPTVRLLVSMVPSSGDANILPVLLEAAHSSGFNAGTSWVTTSMSMLMIENAVREEK